MILLGWEDLWSCFVGGIMLLLGGQDLWSSEDEWIYDLVRTSGFMILWGRVDLWSCKDEWIYDLAWLWKLWSCVVPLFLWFLVTFMILRCEEVLPILCGGFMILYPRRTFMVLLGRGYNLVNKFTGIFDPGLDFKRATVRDIRLMTTTTVFVYFEECCHCCDHLSGYSGESYDPLLDRKLVILVILHVMDRMAYPTVHPAERGLILYL